MQVKKIILGIVSLAKTVISVAILAFLIRTFLIQTYIIEGPSMEPNFYTGQYLLLDKLSYHLRPPARGEIVVLHPPQDPTVNYIKRVIGLPGDTVEIAKNKVFVNGLEIQEPYLRTGTITTAENNKTSYKLGAEDYFVLGDNRPQSKDSRSIGAITKNEIIGRTFVIVFPLANAHLVGVN